MCTTAGDARPAVRASGTTEKGAGFMKGWLPFAIGLLAVVMGAVWTLQGLDLLGGSAMSGSTFWAVVGPVVVAGGIALIVVGLRIRRRP